VLLVCEGHAEEGFLKHLRTLYLNRQGNTALQVKNARGKGGRHVLNVARRRQVRRGFDTVAVLVDTDTDWDDAQRRIAREEGISVFESSPCFEALLLMIEGRTPPGGTQACKTAFSKHFGFDAHDVRLYERHLGLAIIQKARARVRLLNQLLSLISSN
jgi:hypothetical protein